jgi:O-antigen/teichoic acid export membrane protein
MKLTGMLGRTGANKPIATNLWARIAALGALMVSSLLVARIGGPALVGIFVLLRMVPWLAGLLTTGGLYGAAPYFLAAEKRSGVRYGPTIFWMAVTGGLVGSLAWLGMAPLLQNVLFPQLGAGLVAWAAISVFTQVMETSGKASSQGFDDLTGSNRIIALEEIVFLPYFLALYALGVDARVAIIAALPLGDLTVAVPAWLRLRRRGLFRGAGGPSLGRARRVVRYGLRAQVGSVILLLNARLDFALVGGLVGSRALGIYAIASRFAELLRLPSLAVNYVLYPAYARRGGAAAAREARAMMPRVGWIPLAAAVPFGVAATFFIPWLYGEPFQAAITPTYVLLLGLSGSAIAGVITAFLYGDGRPGLNSLAMGAGLLITIALDLLLIPRFGVLGAALASSVAYLSTTAFLVVSFAVLARGRVSGRGDQDLHRQMAELKR